MTKKIRYSKANSSAEDDAHSKYWEREKSGDLTRTQRYLKNHLEELRKQIEDECEKLGKKVESKATSNIIKEMQSNSQNIFSNIFRLHKVF